VAVGTVYNVTTPLFEAPDEQWHFAFVQHLSTGGGLPVYGEDPQAAYRAEGFQPPLYYLTAAPFISRIDTSGWTGFAVLNPQAAIGLPHLDRNKNAVVHTDGEAFPYAGTALAVHLLRAVSLLWGLITVLATFLLASEILPGSPVLAYAAAALVAFNPQFLFIKSAVSNDPAVSALCTVALLLTVRLLVHGSSLARLGALGVVLGLAAISKLNALPMFGLVALALLVLGWRERSWRGLIGKAALVFGLAALVGGWWFARNLALYGDPLAQGVWYSALGRAPTETPLLDLLPEMEGLELSFWAVFGWMNVLADQPVYDALRLVTRVAVAGLAVWFAM
ncbi:MAG: glycosyltransferase family 39 protein, partial [Chloroflexota bacterium]|nr:glycosyltransferase family 39 protein [Chloroflexota bacterium]